MTRLTILLLLAALCGVTEAQTPPMPTLAPVVVHTMSPRGAASQQPTQMAVVVPPAQTNQNCIVKFQSPFTGWLAVGTNADIQLTFNLFYLTNTTSFTVTNLPLFAVAPEIYFFTWARAANGFWTLPFTNEVGRYVSCIIFSNPTTNTVLTAGSVTGPWSTAAWQSAVSYIGVTPPGNAAYFRLAGTKQSVQFASGLRGVP